MNAAAVALTTASRHLRSSALAPGASGMLAASVLLGVGALNALLAAQALGPSGKGLVAVVAVVNSVLVLALGLSLESGVMYHGARLDEAARLVLARRAVLLAAVLALPAALGAAGVVVLLRGDLVSGHWALLVSAAWATQICVGPLVGLARLQGRLHHASWLPAVVACGPFAGSAVALLVTPSVEAYLAGVAAGAVLSWAVYLPEVRRVLVVPPEPLAGPPAVPLTAVVRYSLRGHPGALLHGLNLRVPLLVLAVTSSDAVVGVFSIAVAVAEVPLVISQGLLSWTLSHAALSPSSFAVLGQAVRLTLGGTVAGSALLLVLAPAALPALFGPEFSASLTPLAWCLPGVACLAVWRLCAYDLAVRGDPRTRTTSSAAGTAAALTAAVVLCAHYGASGAAAAATVTFAVMLGSLLARRPDIRRALVTR